MKYRTVRDKMNCGIMHLCCSLSVFWEIPQKIGGIKLWDLTNSINLNFVKREITRTKPC